MYRGTLVANQRTGFPGRWADCRKLHQAVHYEPNDSLLKKAYHLINRVIDITPDIPIWDQETYLFPEQSPWIESVQSGEHRLPSSSSPTPFNNERDAAETSDGVRNAGMSVWTTDLAGEYAPFDDEGARLPTEHDPLKADFHPQLRHCNGLGMETPKSSILESHNGTLK